MVSLQCMTYMHGVAAAIRICSKAIGLGGLPQPQVSVLHMEQKILLVLLQRTLPCILGKYLWPKYISQPL